MHQCVQELVPKPVGLSAILGTRMVEGENQCLDMCAVACTAHPTPTTYTQTHKDILNCYKIKVIQKYIK